MMHKFIFSIFFLTIVTTGAYAEEAVIFSRLTDGYWQVWAMNPDGTNQKKITDSKMDKRDPVCTDNGKKILFRTNNGQLFMKNLSNSAETELLAKYQMINNPDVCPVNNELLFVRFDPRETDISDIWKSDMEGKDTKILTKDRRLKYQPVFSGLCDQIAFVKADESRHAHHVWIMMSSGDAPRQLTAGEKGFDVLPDFLPGDKGVVFSSNRDGKDYEIYTIGLNETTLTQLTENDVIDTSPSVSGQGNGLIFVSSRSGEQQVWRMDLDGKNAVQLTQGEDESVDPQWCLAGGGDQK